ncbi:MAG: DnaD domain protein [Lachnospiraceae bacterium]|nr:DnaD domain protein [Lachnospiraceae bacterium]
MSRLTIYKNNHKDSTVISNLFIDLYMEDANDAQIKVYLYLLRMMDAHQATSVSDMADKFNYTEKDVLRALAYWEKRQLLDLEYDGAQNLTGIHIRELSPQSGTEEECNVPMASCFVPSSAAKLQSLSPAPSDAVSGKVVAAFVSAPAEIPSYEKPSYSADQLQEFKNQEGTAQLLFIAESYIGRPLTIGEMKTMLYFMDVLHFSDDLIDYLLQYCVDRDKKDFRYIEKVAVSWAEQGITTPKQAQKSASKYDKNVYAIMNGLGKSGVPTSAEMDYITRWLKEYHFSTDIIMEACDRTVLATDTHRFQYADGILSSWKAQNVRHKSDILQIDDMYQQRKKNTGTTQQRQSVNRFNQFTQNQYDFDQLEQELLSN